MARLIDADALYNGTMKDEYFEYVERDNHGRESFAYSCAMQRLAEAPTIDAIPVEWMVSWINRHPNDLRCVWFASLEMEWRKEQGAQGT